MELEMTEGNGKKDVASFKVKAGLAQMLKGGVIMDVVTAEHAKIAEDAGAVAVMALERVPADIRADGGVARMSDPELIYGIMDAVSIPVMAKVRIGHFVEAQILESIGVDYIDESEVLKSSLRVRLPQSGRSPAPRRRRCRHDPHQRRGRHRRRGRSCPPCPLGNGFDPPAANHG
jgi:hypothetical protein